jgi:hypothetical protein
MNQELSSALKMQFERLKIERNSCKSNYWNAHIFVTKAAFFVLAFFF